MRREAEAAHGFLDAPLAVEVRDARPLLRGPNGCVDVVFDAGLARQRRKTLALRLFPFGARFPRVLHAEDAPRASQCRAQRRLVIEIAFDDLDAAAGQRRRRLALGLARQAAQMKPFALQRLRDRAALMACHSGDENCFHEKSYACRASLASSHPSTAPEAPAWSNRIWATAPSLSVRAQSRCSSPAMPSQVIG